MNDKTNNTPHLKKAAITTASGVGAAGAAAGIAIAAAAGVALLPAALIGVGVAGLTSGIAWIVKNSRAKK